MGAICSIQNARPSAPPTSSCHYNLSRCSPLPAFKNSLCTKGINLGREKTLNAGETLLSQLHSSDRLTVIRVSNVKEEGHEAQSVTKLLTLVMWFQLVLRIRITQIIAYLIWTKSSLLPYSHHQSSMRLSYQVKLLKASEAKLGPC